MKLLTQPVLDILWLLLLAAYILLGVPDVPFHGDESTQIYMGRDFHYQFVQGDLDRVRYSDQPVSATEQHLRLINGTVPKYLFGWAGYSLGYTPETTSEQWDWGADWDYNLSNRALPPDDLLLRARTLSALGLVVGLLAMYGMGRMLMGRPTALLAALFFAFNPMLLVNGRRAMMEGWMIGFGLLVVLAGLWALRSRRWPSLLLLGIVSGLALASKHTAVITLLAVYASLWLLWTLSSWRMDRDWRRMLLPVVALLSSGLVALLVFYLLNPGWWGDPLARAQVVLAMRTELLTEQVALFPSYQGPADRLAGFARQVLLARPQYYEVAGWQAYIGPQILRYEQSLWPGWHGGGTWLFGIASGVLSLYGLLRMAHQPDERHLSWLILIWAALTLAFTLILTPLEWGRYYLPAYPVMALAGAVGLTALLGWWHQPDTETRA